MESLTKNRSLISIIIILLISNIAILIFFLFLSGDKRAHTRDNRNGISTFLQKDMGFNKQQMDEYQKLREEHIKKAEPLFEDIRSSKNNFYNFLYTDSTPDSVVNKAAAVIGEKQITLDMQMFQHLKKVRTLCTPDELPKFDSLFKKIVERMTGGRFKKQQHTHDK